MSLIGNVTILPTNKKGGNEGIKECYLAKHPDAGRWLPEDDDAAHIVESHEQSSIYYSFMLRTITCSRIGRGLTPRYL